MNVLIADDHAPTRLGLRDLLAEAFPAAHFVDAANAKELMDRLSEAQYDLVLLDINMPGRNGLHALRDVRALHPRLPVVIVSAHSSEEYAEPCRRLGASAYINKISVAETLIPAVVEILSEHPVESRAVDRRT